MVQMLIPASNTDRKDLSALAGRADAQRLLECLLEALRGMAGGVTARTQEPIFAALHSLMGPLLALADAFAGYPPAQLLLLKLAGDCVEAHVSYLQVFPSLQVTLLDHDQERV